MLPSVGPNVIIANIALAQEDRERPLGPVSILGTLFSKSRPMPIIGSLIYAKRVLAK